MFSANGGGSGGYSAQGSSGGYSAQGSSGYSAYGSGGGGGVSSTTSVYSTPSPIFSSGPSTYTTHSIFSPSHGHYHTYNQPDHVDLDCCCRII